MVPLSNAPTHLDANLKGRDFVVGCAYGHKSLLINALAAVNFKPDADRVFSVGNLINHGPDNLGMLELLKEPWFIAVRGLYETQALAWLTKDLCWGVPPQDFLFHGGNWIHGLSDDAKAEVAGLLKALPLGIRVDHAKAPFRVVHAIWSPVLNEPVPAASWRAMDAIHNNNLLVDAMESVRHIGLDFSKDAGLVKTPSWDDDAIAGRLTYCAGPASFGLRVLHHGHIHMDGGLGVSSALPIARKQGLPFVSHDLCLAAVNSTPSVKGRSNA